MECGSSLLGVALSFLPGRNFKKSFPMTGLGRVNRPIGPDPVVQTAKTTGPAAPGTPGKSPVKRPPSSRR
jgi:hypothetical protein